MKEEISINIIKEKTKLSLYAVDTIVHKPRDFYGRIIRNNKRI